MGIHLHKLILIFILGITCSLSWGHETPLKNFEAIEKTMKDVSMPPLRHRIMHRDSKITEDEMKQVEKWIKESREILK